VYHGVMLLIALALAQSTNPLPGSAPSNAPGVIIGAPSNAPGVVIGAPTSSLNGISKRRISLDLQGADIHTVMRFMAEYGNINIVLSEEVSGKVTVRLVEVPWDEAFTAILLSQGLVATRLDGTLLIAPLSQ
jgi:hypothetical protein